MSSECIKKIFFCVFFFFSSPQEDINAFLGQRVTIPSLGLCALSLFFFFLYNSAHLLATTLGIKGIWLLILL